MFTSVLNLFFLKAEINPKPNKETQYWVLGCCSAYSHRKNSLGAKIQTKSYHNCQRDVKSHNQKNNDLSNPYNPNHIDALPFLKSEKQVLAGYSFQVRGVTLVVLTSSHTHTSHAKVIVFICENITILKSHKIASMPQCFQGVSNQPVR